jgi:phenylpyruvate tautomerase PptA (4-oxalocrotonate tautomerase family)
MPILDVEVVGQQAGDPPTEKLAERIANGVGAALGVPKGQLWVKVQKVSASGYAAVSEATTRPRASVHVIFEPDATGRVFFGGEPDSRSG